MSVRRACAPRQASTFSFSTLVHFALLPSGLSALLHHAVLPVATSQGCCLSIITLLISFTNAFPFALDFSKATLMPAVLLMQTYLQIYVDNNIFGNAGLSTIWCHTVLTALLCANRAFYAQPHPDLPMRSVGWCRGGHYLLALQCGWWQAHPGLLPWQHKQEWRHGMSLASALLKLHGPDRSLALWLKLLSSLMHDSAYHSRLKTCSVLKFDCIWTGWASEFVCFAVLTVGVTPLQINRRLKTGNHLRDTAIWMSAQQIAYIQVLQVFSWDLLWFNWFETA